ncbi:MAG: glycosyltransferase [Solirubrobacteraceae bacterium]|nr:glycosyltransferase [Solirubrobacteraceae bacterium]
MRDRARHAENTLVTIISRAAIYDPVVPRVLLTFEPPDGGVAEHVLQLARALPERGFEVELAGPLEADFVYGQLDPAIKVHRIAFQRGYGDPKADLKSAVQLSRVVKRGRYDLVHAHSAKAGVVARSVLAGRKPPVIYSPHCFPFIGDFGNGRRIFATTVERMLAPTTARILCVCDDERQEGLRVGIKHRRMRVIHNGSKALPPATEPLAELEAFRGEDGVLVGSVAVLREQKRVDVLIDAAPSILASDPRARVAIIGNGPLQAELRARATSLGLLGEDRFAFFPFQPPAFGALAALDVYVLPSSWEAFPIGVLEAMATGIPQVATDVGGTREAVVDGYGRASHRTEPDAPQGTEIEGETGLLVPPADHRALAAAVNELVPDARRRQAMADASRERHAERFTLSKMADGIADAYREVLSGK